MPGQIILITWTMAWNACWVVHLINNLRISKHLSSKGHGDMLYPGGRFGPAVGYEISYILRQRMKPHCSVRCFMVKHAYPPYVEDSSIFLYIMPAHVLRFSSRIAARERNTGTSSAQFTNSERRGSLNK
ncbi:hypothetical protein C0J52_21515 [Blattella germanica]|nr:hypothetical protein C0J52_21515 [Blattella germanica]